ncbi:hypothetical protein PGTUg99_017951 [Puccinia graminis f. sp. tritici]|uniref:Uncharacterized protein n=1 Tax=Puccinia graminis f. sp. tritici TaxID=56615 RepID=A0A5B0NKE3_PUCGR|nr:hypothetical protein PGTUg99_017951 [Puccinia graminis f. sp. tritici]
MINLMSVPHRIHNRPPKVTIPMNKLIASKTENVITQWPWTDNEAQLAAQGFRMVLDPHMRTPLEKLQNPSRSLKVGEIKSLLLDIADDYIDVVRVTDSSRCSQSQKPSTTDPTVSSPNGAGKLTDNIFLISCLFPSRFLHLKLFPLFFWVSHCLACLLLAICP